MLVRSHAHNTAANKPSYILGYFTDRVSDTLKCGSEHVRCVYIKLSLHHVRLFCGNKRKKTGMPEVDSGTDKEKNETNRATPKWRKGKGERQPAHTGYL